MPVLSFKTESINMYMRSKEFKNNKDLYENKKMFLEEMIDILGDWLTLRGSIDRRNSEPLKF